MPEPPHFSLPLRIGRDGTFKTIEQNTQDDVVQCVNVIVATPIGSRIELPAFGIPPLEFTQPIPLANILAAIYTWEPRAMALVSRAIAGNDELQSNMTVEVVS